MNTEDQALVDQFLEGDTKAFSAIVDKHRGRLTKVARRYAQDDNEVQDIVQDALFKASRRMDTFRHESTLSTWLHRIVMNTGFDYVEKSKRNEVLTFDSIDEERNASLSVDPMPTVEHALYVEKVLGKLSEDHRHVLILTELEGYSAVDAAKMLGVAPGTIKSRRARAKEALKTVIS